MGSASYPEEDNIFPNRPHWLENGVDFVKARNVPPVCWCPKDKLLDENLCQACQKIGLRHLIFCEAEARWQDLEKLDMIMKRTNCELCSLITLACKQVLGPVDRNGHLLGTQTHNNIVGLDVHNQQKRGYALMISADWQWVDFEVVYKGKGVPVNPAARVDESHPRVDAQFLKAKLQACDQDHPGCKESTYPSTPSQMCIIDLDNMNIGPAPQDCRYCALSYVWGRITEHWLTLTRENVDTLREKNSLATSHLPATIRDAMQLCRDLGERYLWIDSLCIIQNDPIFQKQQIDIMDEIYACASFTIIAAAGDHANAGLPGMRTWLRDAQRQIITIQDIEVSNSPPRLSNTAEHSVWNTRGWTYQERMFSQRAIFLTEVQAYYACPHGVEAEIPHRLHPSNYSVDRFQNLTTSKSLMATYTRSVAEYSLRSLTNQADILRAFLGVANHLSKKYKEPFLYGLPAYNIKSAMLWQPLGDSTTRRVPGVALPSWSWASQQGGIKYTFLEDIVDEALTESLPAFWQVGEEPNLFRNDWFLNVDGTKIINIETSVKVRKLQDGLLSSSNTMTPFIPDAVLQLGLQRAGRLLFSTQCTSMLLRNSVRFVTADSWWTDYTTDVDLSRISMISIYSQTNATEPAGYMEMNKAWADHNLTATGNGQPWEFVALSLSTTNKDDYMHRHFTMRRNYDYSMLYSRNVRRLVVNVMLVQWKDEVATRLGVGKIYLDYWENEKPQIKWVVLD